MNRAAGFGTRSARRPRLAKAGTAVVLAAASVLAGCGLLPGNDGEDRGPGIAVGACLTDPARSQEQEEEGSPASAGLVSAPCEEPHDYEAFAATDLTGDAYPGDAQVTRSAQDFCVAEFQTFVGLPHRDSDLVLRYVHPNAASWEAGDRTVTCLVSGEGQTTGSLRNARR